MCTGDLMLMVNQLVGFQAVAADDFSAAALSLNAWWDPSDLTTLWQDTGRTTPVTADGQSVYCMDDKSGNGRHLSAPGAAPIYKTSGGLHWLEFNGSSQYLRSSVRVSAAIGQSCAEVFAAFRLSSPDTSGVAINSDVCFGDDFATTAFGAVGSSNVVGLAAYNVSASVVTVTASYTVGSDVVISCGWDGTNMRLSADNAADTTATFSSQSIDFSGNNIILGSNQSYSKYSPMRFYGGGMKSAAVTVGDRTAFCSYLGNKQGRSI